MTTTFTEMELPDGYIQVSWDADTPREWKRILTAIKTMIPQKERAYVPIKKSWTIAPSSRSIYEEIREAAHTDNGEELLGSIADDSIRDEAILNAMNNKLNNLPISMKRRAIFAVSAAIGLIDAPIELSYSKGLFGAFDSEEEHWVYEDGRYSQYSPSEWDAKARATAYKRLQIAQKSFPEIISALDKAPPDREKYLFRLAILERYNHSCYICSKQPQDLRSLHMHRVLPGKNGGQYMDDNVVLLCVGCHRKFEGHGWSVIKEARAERVHQDEYITDRR